MPNNFSPKYSGTLTIEQALLQAVAHHNDGRLHDAERLYRSILQAQPGHPDANHNLGMLAVQVNQVNAGLPHLKAALEANPGQTQYWLSYIDALMQAGSTDVARQVMLQGRQLGLNGKELEALELRLEESAGSEPGSPEINSLVSLYSAGQFAEVASLAQSMTARFPEYEFGWRILGAALMQMGRNAEALVFMQQAVNLAPNVAETQYNLAYLLKETEHIAEAEAAYLRAIELKPDFTEACFNLGTLLKETRRPAEAEAYFRRVLDMQPLFTEAYINLGCLFQESKRLPEAETAFLRAIEIKPECAEAYYNLGTLLMETQRLSEAEATFLRALEVKPDYPETLYNLGTLFMKTQRLAAAEAAYLRAIELKPDFVDAHFSLGTLLIEMKQLPKAEAAFLRTLELRPDYAKAHNNLGIILMKTQRHTEAEATILRALELMPNYAEAHYNLGSLLMETNRLSEAEATFQRTLELMPDYAEAHNNLGWLLKEAKRLSEAEETFHRALKLKPDFAEAHFNLGTLYIETMRLSEAEAAYLRALETKPDYADVQINLSLLLLTQGRYIEAWPYFESRYDPKRNEDFVIKPSLPFPQWRGESLLDKSLLICPEQGYGDYIQFARYAPLLKNLGVSCLTFVCHPSLKTLLETVEGVDAVTTDPDAVAPHDYWSLPLSLPLRFGSTLETIPASLPYIHAPPQRLVYWHDRLPQKGLKVGLVWKGNPGHKNDANRSLPGLASLAPLWSVPGITFFSLQKGQGENEAIRSTIEQPIIHLGSDIGDFADTAAIVTQLDLVICVDTAVAHVASALGKPCWVLLPAFGADWRWLQDRTDSPWYPGAMRLFRQSKLNDWDETISEVVAELRLLAGNFKHE